MRFSAVVAGEWSKGGGPTMALFFFLNLNNGNKQQMDSDFGHPVFSSLILKKTPVYICVDECSDDVLVGFGWHFSPLIFRRVVRFPEDALAMRESRLMRVETRCHTLLPVP
jgi:hypothetical protein